MSLVSSVKISACRLGRPNYAWAKKKPEIKSKNEVIESFNREELENEITLNSVRDRLSNIDNN